MSRVAGINDFDHAILDKDGRRGVKDGKEFPISEEEWRAMNPEHKDTGCKECSFVQDKETLFIYLIPRELKEKATEQPLFFGKFTMPGWIGHNGFYLFRCELCNQVSVDYPHGYTNFGLMFLRCDHCKGKLPLEVIEEKAIYEREKVFIPKPTVEERVHDLNEAVAKVSREKGVRAVVFDLDPKMLNKKGSRFNIWNIGLFLLVLWTIGVFFFTHPNWRPF